VEKATPWRVRVAGWLARDANQRLMLGALQQAKK